MEGLNSNYQSILIGSSSTIAEWIKLSLNKMNISSVKIGRKDLTDLDAFADITNYDQVCNAYKKVIDKNSLNISIYYCCGSMEYKSIYESNPSSWENDIKVNLIGAYNIYRALFDNNIPKQFIKLIYIGSTSSVSRPRNCSSYSISKLALEQLVTYINNESIPNLRACCLRLGTTQTSFSGAIDRKDAVNRIDIENLVNSLEKARFDTFPDLISSRPIVRE